MIFLKNDLFVELGRSDVEMQDAAFESGDGFDSAADQPRPEQPLGRGSALSRLGAELELRRSGSSLGPSQ